MKTLSVATATIAALLSIACSGGAGAEDDLGGMDVRIVPDAALEDARAGDETVGRDEGAGTDTGETDSGSTDTMTLADTTSEDVAPPDTGTPDTTLDQGTVTEVEAYGECNNDAECEGVLDGVPVSMECFVFPDGKYGFCTRGCTKDEDCPSHPSGYTRGCYIEDGDTSGTCLLLCGAVGGGNGCPAHLQCVSSQFCLPPSTTVATKEAGEACTGPAECLSGECIEGEATRAHCALKCQTNEDCAGPDGLWAGTCTNAGGLNYNFCIFMCGMMGGGKSCPGELECVGMSVCQ